MNQQGRSMIEMLGVLAIIGVLSVGGIAGYSKAMQSYRTNKTIDQVTQIANGIRTLFIGQKTYTSLGEDGSTAAKILKKAKILPESSFEGSDASLKVRNVFGGEIQVIKSTKTTFPGADDGAFILAFTNIPDDACVELASQDWGRKDLIGVSVNNPVALIMATTASCTGAARSGQAVSCASSGAPMPVGTAVAACDGQNNQNTLTWKMY